MRPFGLTLYFTPKVYNCLQIVRTKFHDYEARKCRSKVSTKSLIPLTHFGQSLTHFEQKPLKTEFLRGFSKKTHVPVKFMDKLPAQLSQEKLNHFQPQNLVLN